MFQFNDEDSDFFMEMIQIKVNTLSPTATPQLLSDKKHAPLNYLI